ncbi:MAG: PilZ domain-containing protein [Planctomycetes bacterium]|nr:PilZ domain-containing protein [Planctomycetota bacterium]
MERGSDRRRHTRLPLRLTVVCRRVGTPGERVYSGSTVNVSPGGMLMEINMRELETGELLNVDMTVPPDEELLEFGGRFSNHARVVRVDALPRRSRSGSAAQRIALEFCDSPKLRV